MKTEIIDRLKALRSEMTDAGVDITIIPRTDPHLSEYISDHWHTVRWLSGFTGSAGTLVVTATEALFWTDSRYFLQAAEQLDGTTIALMKDGLPETPYIDTYVVDHLPQGGTLGIDGMLFSIDATDRLRRLLAPGHFNLDVDFAPFDRIWGDRPALPSGEVFVHEIKYAGETAREKMDRVLADVRVQGAGSVFISDLAEIAWTLNIRCNDVPCNPVVTCFLLLDPQGSTLFIDGIKLGDTTRLYLKDNGVKVVAYNAVRDILSDLPSDSKVLLSATQSAGALVSILGDRAVIGTSPVAMLKAVKNQVQIAGVRSAMIKDGVALVRSFMELEDRIDRKSVV